MIGTASLKRSRHHAYWPATLRQMEDVSLPLKDIAAFLGMSVEMLSRVYGQSRLEAQVPIGDAFSNKQRVTTASEAKKQREAATANDRYNAKELEITYIRLAKSVIKT